MLKKKFRLTQDQDFLRLRKKGFRGRTKNLLVSWYPNQLPFSRFGFVASKRTGKAADRNRGVRLLREIIRLNLTQIKKGMDVVLILKNNLAGLTYGQLEEEVMNFFSRVSLKPKTEKIG